MRKNIKMQRLNLDRKLNGEREMREYINFDIKIDGRNIPYPVFTSSQYFLLRDKVNDVDGFIDINPEINELVTQILALKQT